jgi:hypothetical protein
MVHISVIQSQLTKLGCRLSRWFTPEIRELQHILMDDEKIIGAAAGRYFNGFALLVSTEQRLLLIDKRAFFMIVEDIRYDMISEIDFASRLYNFTIYIFTLNKQHNFTTIRYKKQLRDLTNYSQQKVWQLRQYQEQPSPVPSSAVAAQSSLSPGSLPQSPPLATSTTPTLPHIPQPLHMPHLHRPSRPHLPRHIGFAAMNDSRRFTPNAYTNHLTHRRPLVANLAENPET